MNKVNMQIGQPMCSSSNSTSSLHMYEMEDEVVDARLTECFFVINKNEN